jgi:hypothetical protein
VVKDRYSSLIKLEHTKPGFVNELLAALTVRYQGYRFASNGALRSRLPLSDIGGACPQRDFAGAR